MTAITIYQSKSGDYRRLFCKGHAGYARAGKDIVCASVSVLVINTINSLEALAQEKIEVVSDKEKGIIDCSFIGELSDKGRLLMDSLILGLENIEGSYGKKYLELNFEEV